MTDELTRSLLDSIESLRVDVREGFARVEKAQAISDKRLGSLERWRTATEAREEVMRQVRQHAQDQSARADSHEGVAISRRQVQTAIIGVTVSGLLMGGGLLVSVLHLH